MHEVSLDKYLQDLEDLWTALCVDDNGMSIDAITSVLNKIVETRELLNEIKFEQLEDEN